MDASTSAPQWVVGYFEAENKFSVIPINWINKSNTDNVYYCKWPSSGQVTSKMILKRVQPGRKWISYPVKIIERFDTYEAAASKEVQLFLSNLAEESDASDHNNDDGDGSNFVRLPRVLNDIENYKGTELRTILLYTGPIIFKGRLKKLFYSHFLKLHCAIKILVTPELCFTNNDMADKLLIEFVNEFRTIYGATFVTYNVHNLIHLPFYVRLHGCLDNFGAFKFENFLGILKKKISHSRYPLQEAINRTIETMNILKSPNNNICTDADYKLGKECDISIDTMILNNEQGHTFYESIYLSDTNYFLSIKDSKNSYIMLKTNEITSVKDIVQCKNGNIFLNVRKFISKSSILFNSPIPSDVIGTILVDLTSQSSIVRLNLNDIKFKCFVVNVTENKIIAMTLSHNSHF